MKIKMLRIIIIIPCLSLFPSFMGLACEMSETDKLEIKQIIQRFSPPPGKSKLYIAHLSFMDARTQSSMVLTAEAELIDDFIVKGIKELQKQIPTLAVNVTGHIIKNNDKNINDLVNITFDPNLTKKEKINKIIAELMTPNNVDMIITGQYIDDCKNNLISIRPLVIVKASRKILTKNLQFTRKELFCQDPINKKMTLCSVAHDQFARAFLEILEQL